MRQHDFIPSNDGKFEEWAKILLNYLESRLVEFGIQQDKFDDLKQLYDVFSQKYKVASNPETRTSGSIISKTESRKLFEKNARVFVKAYLAYNPSVLDEDRENMGLTVRKTTRTKLTDPVTVPSGSVETPYAATVRINFRDKNGIHKSKPPGIHGCDVCWAILESPPEDWSQLTHSSFHTTTPVDLTFTGYERGQTLYFALRWENNRGQKGHWSEIQSAVIP